MTIIIEVMDEPEKGSTSPVHRRELHRRTKRAMNHVGAVADDFGSSHNGGTQIVRRIDPKLHAGISPIGSFRSTFHNGVVDEVLRI